MQTVRSGGSARLWILIVLCLIALCAGCSKKQEQEAKPPAAGTGQVIIERASMAPDAGLRSVDGSTQFLSDLKGKIVVLNFWATWNADCRQQIPALTAIAAEFERYNIVVLGVSIDDGGARALTTFTAANSVGYPLFYNGKEVLGKFGGLRKLPTTFLITRDGRIYDKLLGVQTKKFLTDRIREMMSQRL